MAAKLSIRRWLSLLVVTGSRLQCMIMLDLVHSVSYLTLDTCFGRFPLLREWWGFWGANFHFIVTRNILIPKLEAGGVTRREECEPCTSLLRAMTSRVG
jgi:hypothetical protein